MEKNILTYLYINIIGSFCDSLFLFYALKAIILRRDLQPSPGAHSTRVLWGEEPLVQGMWRPATHRGLVLKLPAPWATYLVLLPQRSQGQHVEPNCKVQSFIET